MKEIVSVEIPHNTYPSTKKTPQQPETSVNKTCLELERISVRAHLLEVPTYTSHTFIIFSKRVGPRSKVLERSSSVTWCLHKSTGLYFLKKTLVTLSCERIFFRNTLIIAANLCVWKAQKGWTLPSWKLHRSFQYEFLSNVIFNAAMFSSQCFQISI